jgi:hypothetical protein
MRTYCSVSAYLRVVTCTCLLFTITYSDLSGLGTHVSRQIFMSLHSFITKRLIPGSSGSAGHVVTCDILNSSKHVLSIASNRDITAIGGQSLLSVRLLETWLLPQQKLLVQYPSRRLSIPMGRSLSMSKFAYPQHGLRRRSHWHIILLREIYPSDLGGCLKERLPCKGCLLRSARTISEVGFSVLSSTPT